MDCKGNCLHCTEKECNQANTKSNTNQHGNCELKDEEIIKGYCNKKLCPPAQEIINRKKAEIEVLKTNNHSLCATLSNRAKVERAEALKEFAERLKSKFTHSGKSTKYGDFTWDDVTSYEIDNLVKEMTGQ